MSQVQTPAAANTEILISREVKPKSFPLELRILCGFMSFVNDRARRKDGTFNQRMMNLIEYKVAQIARPPVVFIPRTSSSIPRQECMFVSSFLSRAWRSRYPSSFTSMAEGLLPCLPIFCYTTFSARDWPGDAES